MRLSWSDYFMKIVDAAALRATCDRGKSGAIIVKDNRIVAAGYVGSPSGFKHCDEIGHEIYQFNVTPLSSDHSKTIGPTAVSTHCLRTVHAEMNAICNAARHGVSTMNATMYCSMVPCRNCAHAIIQAGITKVIAKNHYHKGEKTIEILKEAGVVLFVYSDKLSYDPNNTGVSKPLS